MEYSGKNEVTFRRVDASMEGLTEDGAEKNEETRAALEALAAGEGLEIEGFYELTL